MPRRNESHRVALCGVLCALGIALLLLGSVLQIGTYAAPMLACFLLVPVGEEYGPKYMLLLYLATAVLSVLLLPDKELALFYALVLGYYPALKKLLDRLHPAPLRWLAKLACFNAATLAMYALLLAVFASPALREEFAGFGAASLIALLALGNLSFLLCDVALTQFTLLYRFRLRHRLRKFF